MNLNNNEDFILLWHNNGTEISFIIRLYVFKYFINIVPFYLHYEGLGFLSKTISNNLLNYYKVIGYHQLPELPEGLERLYCNNYYYNDI